MRVPLLLACVLAVAACAPAAAAVPEPALQDDRLFVGGTGHPTPTALDRAAGLASARRLGVRRLRMNVVWARVQPSRGSFAFAPYADAISAARRAGLRVQLTVTGPAPGWATADGRPGTLRPGAAAFGRFAGAVAAATQGAVDRVALWNEPNWHRSLRPVQAAPRLYRRLFQAGAAAVRRRAPGTEVLFGELAPVGRLEAATAPLAFLRGVTCTDRHEPPRPRCAPLRADAVAVHPYTLRWRPTWPGGRDDVTTGSLRRFSSVMERLRRLGRLTGPGGGRLPIDVTEWGWHARSRRIPEPLRSRFLTQGMRLLRSTPGVRTVTWYELLGEPDGSAAVWDTGLLAADGSERPAYKALRRAFLPVSRPGSR